MNSSEAFTRAALYQSCAKSDILRHIDIAATDSETLRDLVNKYSLLSSRKLPIIITKLVVKKLLEFGVIKFPNLKTFVAPHNICVDVEDDELAYLLNTSSTFKPSIAYLVGKNIVISVLGSSIEAFKNDLLSRGSTSDSANIPKITVNSNTAPITNANVPTTYTDTFAMKQRQAFKEPQLNGITKLGSAEIEQNRKIMRQNTSDSNRPNSALNANDDDDNDDCNSDSSYSVTQDNNALETIVKNTKNANQVESKAVIVENKLLTALDDEFIHKLNVDDPELVRFSIDNEINKQGYDVIEEDGDDDDDSNNDDDGGDDDSSINKNLVTNNLRETIYEPIEDITAKISDLRPAVIKANAANFMDLVKVTSPHLLNEQKSTSMANNSTSYDQIILDDDDDNDEDDIVIGDYTNGNYESKNKNVRSNSVTSTTISDKSKNFILNDTDDIDEEMY